MVGHSVTVAFGLFVVMAIEFVDGQQPNKLLTDEGFSEVLSITRDNVPESEVEPIRHAMYRRAIDSDIHRNPSDGFLAGENTPVWLASESNGKVNYKRMSSNFMGKVAKTFPGRSKRDVSGSPAVIKSNGDPYLKGIAGTSTVVEVTKDHFNKAKRDAAVEKKVNDIVQHLNNSLHDRRKRWTGNYVYPSILIVTDYASTPTGQEESAFYESIRYQLAFWNSVDLRYRDLESPKIRLRIAGIVIGQGRKAIPYINDHMNGDKFNSDNAHLAAPEYWSKVATSNKDFGEGAYNILVTMTDRTMYSPTTKNQILAGVATRGSFCHDRNNHKQKATVIVNDDSRYDAIVTATHELGHIFGAEHDINLSGPCAGKLGYIMTEQKSRSNRNNNHWSPCSLNEIKKIFQVAKKCPVQPAEVHKPGTPIQRTVPADYHDALTQCETHKFSWACDPTPKTCKKLQCWYGGVYGISTSWKCQDAPTGALDGTPCAKDAICVRGECRRGDTVVT